MRALALTLALIFSMALPASAQVEKWVDKDGTIHLGNEPPHQIYTGQTKASASGDMQTERWAFIQKLPDQGIITHLDSARRVSW